MFISKFEANYGSRVREYFPGYSIKAITEQVSMVALAADLTKRTGAQDAIVCCAHLTKLLAKYHDKMLDVKKISAHSYRGSVFYAFGVKFLILGTTQFLVYNKQDQWLFRRYAQKITNPNFPVFPELDWRVLNPTNIDQFYEEAKSALLMSIDIETAIRKVNPAYTQMTEGRNKFSGMWFMGYPTATAKKMVPIIPIITMVGYTILLRTHDGKLVSKTGVLYINSMIDIVYMRRFNALEAPKVMQNGGYEATYFARYNAPARNYLYDTYIAMHAWLVELSRDLAFITSLFDGGYIYWKQEAEHNLAEYNAKDCHNTLWSMVHIISQWPQWAVDNYTENFRMQFPCITCGIEGFAVNQTEMTRLRVEREKLVEKNIKRLEKLVCVGFNPNSSQQVLKLMHGLGFKKAKSTDKATLADFIDSHPLYDIIGNLIKEVRKDRKAISTYFTLPLMDGRLLYELNPGGTDTGRLASKASNLWCGTQIQNQPLYTKSMYVADPGYVLNSADNAQSESRCTAYMSEDAGLMEAVESPLDFHKTNSTKFFGLKYEEITKPIRDTGKKVNHGANYNMGARVLLQTMGRKAVVQAARLLNLPRNWGLIDICEYLLQCFDNAYPDVRGKYYKEVIQEVMSTGMLKGATGWTRRCFEVPSKENKLVLNSYVAHGPQSLSVKIINKTFFEAWLYLQIEKSLLRFKAQVHDDLIWQDKPEHTASNAEWISSRMARPTTVRGREMVIPNDLKTGGSTWLELKD